jgi:uncharacterized protein involved in exopolysaccharide biosynthesis
MPTYNQILEAYRHLRRALTRHRKLATIVFAATSVLALAGALFMPRSYYSEARLFVRVGRENLVDPTATDGKLVSLYESRESEINSLIEIMRSRAIFDRVVAELGPDCILYGFAPGPEPVTTAAATDKLRPPTTKHQRAVARLEREITISTPRKSNIITVGCKTMSPQTAQQIVAKLIEVYRDEHVRVHRSPASFEFFQEQAGKSCFAWQRAAEELRDKKNGLGIVTVEGRRKNLEAQLAEIDGRLLTNEAELKTAQSKIASLTALIGKLPQKIVTQAVEGPSGAFDGMRQTLYQLESQQQDLAAKMNDNHPRLVAVREQVAELRSILSHLPTDRVQETEAFNPSRQSLELSLLTERSQAEGLAARERSLAAAREQLRGELTELNAQTGAIDELTQRVDLAEANHKEYAQKVEQSRINRSLDDERISSLTLVQPASFNAKGSGPRRALVLAVALVLAASSGVAAAIAAAWLNPLLCKAAQLESQWDLPLAGVIPANLLRAPLAS